MHHKKRTARLLLCVLALAMALSACGKKGGAFQGTVTQITGTQVTVTPDPGAAILKQADSVTFDASGLENLQAKAGDSVYVTYDSYKKSKADGVVLEATGWQMMIRAPETDPDTVRLYAEQQQAVVEGEDGAFLRQTLTSAKFNSDDQSDNPTWHLRADGTEYGIALTLEENIWHCRLTLEDQAATLTGGDAFRVAAIFAANGLTPADWADVTAASGKKTATTALNLRSRPGTDGDIIAAISAGTAVTVTGQTSTGWYQVLYEEQTLYASAEYLE